MSDPCPARPVPVDEAELARFRRWLTERGFARSTASIWASRVRTAYARGVSSPEEVDRAFANWSRETRGGMRQALREFAAFREGDG